MSDVCEKDTIIITMRDSNKIREIVIIIITNTQKKKTHYRSIKILYYRDIAGQLNYAYYTQRAESVPRLHFVKRSTPKD